VPGHGSGKTSEPVTTTHCVRLLHLEKEKIDQRFHHDYPQQEYSAMTTLITQSGEKVKCYSYKDIDEIPARTVTYAF